MQNELTLPNCNGNRTNIQHNRNMDFHLDVPYHMYKEIVLRIPNPNNWHLVRKDLKHRILDCFQDLKSNKNYKHIFKSRWGLAISSSDFFFKVSKFVNRSPLVAERLAKIQFLGTWNQLKNGLKQVEQGFSSFFAKFLPLFDDFLKV